MTKTLAVLLLLAVLPVQAATKRTVREELEAQYEKLAEANKRKDLAAIMALKTDTFYTIGPRGELNDRVLMEEYSRRFIAGFLPPIEIKQTIVDLKVSEHELVAIVNVRQEVSRFREIDGVRRKVETSVLQRETWVKQNGEWKLHFVDDVHDQATLIDGKPLPPRQ
jgi:hypothetical protein